MWCTKFQKYKLIFEQVWYISAETLDYKWWWMSIERLLRTQNNWYQLSVLSDHNKYIYDVWKLPQKTLKNKKTHKKTEKEKKGTRFFALHFTNDIFFCLCSLGKGWCRFTKDLALQQKATHNCTLCIFLSISQKSYQQIHTKDKDGHY